MSKRRHPPQREVPLVRKDGFHLPVFRRRAMLYVDGFNLFHAVQDLGAEHLKWLDLKALARQIAPPSEAVRGVVWCTAFRPTGRKVEGHHELYRDALEATGVRVLTGHFVIYADGCNACGHMWNVAEEKQSDVNLALAVLNDAFEDRFDVAYLVTTDGDHAATARFLKERFPKKTLVSVAPPGRGWNRSIMEWADKKTQIEPEMLEKALLPAQIRGPNGVIERPAAYDPPTVPRQVGHLTLVQSN
jgi:hypothetical protein